MSRRGAIHRYFLIIEKIRRVGFPSFEELSRHLENQGFEINPRTLQRDIRDLRDEFDIDITYNRQKNGYGIENQGPEGVAAIQLLEAAMEADVLLSSFEDIRAMRDIISFDGTGIMRGIGQLQPLLYALKNRRIVEFDHKSFETGTRKHFRVRPRRLKKYDGRWYLCAEIPKEPRLLKIGIDRIENLVVTDDVFVNPGPSSECLENVIGVSGSDEVPVDVVLEFTSHQGQYIKTLPLHASQELLEDNSERLVIRIHVVDNFELRQRILGYGDSVLVLEPRELVEKIAEALRKNLEKYRERHEMS